MRMDQFTVKAQEVLAAAQTDAEKKDHPETTPEHLLAALLAQEGGVVPAALGKMGVNVATVAQEAQRAWARCPRRAAPPRSSRPGSTPSSRRRCARRTP
jgi:ATP-dependent Clp protease ATP-binding subunit ClpB